MKSLTRQLSANPYWTAQAPPSRHRPPPTATLRFRALGVFSDIPKHAMFSTPRHQPTVCSPHFCHTGKISASLAHMQAKAGALSPVALPNFLSNTDRSSQLAEQFGAAEAACPGKAEEAEGTALWAGQAPAEAMAALTSWPLACRSWDLEKIVRHAARL